MKRTLFLLFALALTLSGCAGTGSGKLASRAQKEKDLLRAAAGEMRDLGEERVYVSLGIPTEDGEAVPGAAECPVRYKKSSDDRIQVESDVLERVLREFGFALILFQTASDGRESVIFSMGKESDRGVVRGVSYSFDGEPVAWWGRDAELIRHKGRFVEINPKGDAWYYTTSLEDGLWYWEKDGTVLG